MKQLSENVIVLEVGDQIPPGTDDAIKILLVGSESIDQPTADGKPAIFDWQPKFCSSVVSLSDQKVGLPMFKGKNYVIINCKYIPQMQPDPRMPDNNELGQKYNFMLEMANQSDVIFCNILKKTQSPLPLFEFGLFVASQKLIIRCPEEYTYYNLIKLVCGRSNISLLPAKSNAKDVMYSVFAAVPKFQEMKKYELPE